MFQKDRFNYFVKVILTWAHTAVTSTFDDLFDDLTLKSYNTSEVLWQLQIWLDYRKKNFRDKQNLVFDFWMAFT